MVRTTRTGRGWARSRSPAARSRPAALRTQVVARGGHSHYPKAFNPAGEGVSFNHYALIPVLQIADRPPAALKRSPGPVPLTSPLARVVRSVRSREQGQSTPKMAIMCWGEGRRMRASSIHCRIPLLARVCTGRIDRCLRIAAFACGASRFERPAPLGHRRRGNRAAAKL